MTSLQWKGECKCQHFDTLMSIGLFENTFSLAGNQTWCTQDSNSIVSFYIKLNGVKLLLRWHHCMFAKQDTSCTSKNLVDLNYLLKHVVLMLSKNIEAIDKRQKLKPSNRWFYCHYIKKKKKKNIMAFRQVVMWPSNRWWCGLQTGGVVALRQAMGFLLAFLQ